MQEKIKALRVSIDGLAQLTKGLKPLFINPETDNRINSKQINKAVDSLLLGKAWLGKLLGELGSPSPYQNDGNRKTVADIEPTADTYDLRLGKTYFDNQVPPKIENEELVDRNHIEKVDWLREQIKTIIDELLGTSFNYEYSKNGQSKADNLIFILNNSLRHLHEARFHLGFEMERIKEAK